MVLQAYIDESVDPDGTFVLAGYVASAEQWAAFSAAWEALLPHCPLSRRGNRRFKMVEMAQTSERMAWVPVFRDVIHDHVQMSISCIVNRHIIDRAISRVSVDNVVIDSRKFRHPYYIAYRGLMDNFHSLRITNPDMVPLGEVVDFYFDDASEKKIVLAAWDDYMTGRVPTQRDMYGRTPRFEDDEQFLPLQAADFWAWWLRKWTKALGPDRVSEGKYPFPHAKKPIYHLVLHQTEEQMIRYQVDNLRELLPEGTVIRVSGS